VHAVTWPRAWVDETEVMQMLPNEATMEKVTCQPQAPPRMVAARESMLKAMAA
jgi:hypothetical protein